jgi:toxin ParE1/3/4
MLHVVWLAEADAELEEALERYERVNPELARSFVEAVLDGVAAIATAPMKFPTLGNGRRLRLPRVRRAAVRRFPYGIFFFVEEARVVVLACCRETWPRKPV